MTELTQLNTLDDVRSFIAEGYRASGDPESWQDRGRPLEFGFEWGKLPLAVAEPGPLIERAVALAGEEGLTLHQIREVFGALGRERLDRGLAFVLEAGRIEQSREMRPNRGGRLQDQVVLRAADQPRPASGD